MKCTIYSQKFEFILYFTYAFLLLNVVWSSGGVSRCFCRRGFRIDWGRRRHLSSTHNQAPVNIQFFLQTLFYLSLSSLIDFFSCFFFFTDFPFWFLTLAVLIYWSRSRVLPRLIQFSASSLSIIHFEYFLRSSSSNLSRLFSLIMDYEACDSSGKLKWFGFCCIGIWVLSNLIWRVFFARGGTLYFSSRAWK